MSEPILNSAYYIQSDQLGSWIEAWSVWHLPFMHLSTDQRRYKFDLGKAVEKLTGQGVLRATYTSRDTRRSPDLENVLFYNVGPARFKNAAVDVLRFERRFDAPPEMPLSPGFEATHHVRYQIE